MLHACHHHKCPALSTALHSSHVGGTGPAVHSATDYCLAGGVALGMPPDSPLGHDDLAHRPAPTSVGPAPVMLPSVVTTCVTGWLGVRSSTGSVVVAVVVE